MVKKEKWPQWTEFWDQQEGRKGEKQEVSLAETEIYRFSGIHAETPIEDSKCPGLLVQSNDHPHSEYQIGVFGFNFFLSKICYTILK
jgi:hypothetical protein